MYGSQKMIKVLDLFSGIGTWTYALESLQVFETVAFCEIDKDCHKVLNKHWPTIPIEKDISKLDASKYKDVDIVTSSFPCVDISIGGKRKGLIDENGERTRSGLWFETKRIIADIKPKYAIIENVGNLRKLGLRQVLSDLAEIGYDAEWYTIRATDVGLPHQRERLFIISYPSKQRSDEHTREERYLQINQERKDSTIHSEGQGCQLKSEQVCPFLSERAFKDYRDSRTDKRATISEICRVTDGIPDKLHEADRKRRIKQLGNAIIPDIAYVIGLEIVKRLIK
jgi:DNA (cytosine-5)-methyltransferase 1